MYQAVDTNNCVGTGAITIDVDSLFANSTAFDICNNTVAGNLATLVTGGAGGNFFEGPIGPVSCSGAAVTISPTGLYNFTAPSGQTGPCTFVYEVTDNFDCIATGAVTITPNTESTVNNATIVSCMNGSVSDTLARLIVGNPPPPLTFTIVTPPTNGTLTSFDPTTGAFTYTPNTGFTGTDSFQFTVTDSGTPPCTTNIGTVTITIDPAPVALNATFNTCQNVSINGSMVPFVSGGVPPYTFSVVGSAVNGTVVVNPDGTFTFTPATGFVGIGSFQYQAVDSLGCISNVATITINIPCCPPTNPFFALIEELYWNLPPAI